MYLDENATLQLHPAGSSRGKMRIPENFLLEKGEEAHCYKPFPVLMGQASTEGIAQRLELSIRNSRETLRVWWGEVEKEFDEFREDPFNYTKDTVKGTVDKLRPYGTIQNQGSRPIYMVLSDTDPNYRKDDYIRELFSGSAYTGHVDGAVDIEGKVVVKKGESTDLTFTGENKFHLGFSILEKMEGAVKNLGIGDALPYGLYYGKRQNGSLHFFYEDGNIIGEAIEKWYNMTFNKAKVDL